MAALEAKQRVKGGPYYAVGSIAGKRIRQSLKTRDRDRAVELCAILEAKLWKQHSYGDEAVRTFEEAVVSYLEAGNSPRFVPPLLKRFRGRVLGTIKPEEIRQAARALYPGSKGSTLNRQAIVPARAIINHAADLGWCPKIVVKSFPVEKAQRRAADREWMDAFLAQADKDKLHHLAACVLFMFQTGARVSEAIRVMPAHVDLERRVVTLERTKTDKWEAKHITQELADRLSALSMNRRKPVFRYADRFGVKNRMMAVCRRAGIEYLPPHQAGRHSFATNALQMGATVKEVMEGGGWKSARMVLEIYAKATEGGRSIADRFDTHRAQSEESDSDDAGQDDGNEG